VPGGDIGLLYYTPKMFANLILRLAFQLLQPVGDHNDSSGVLIRFKHPRHPVGDRVSPGTSHVYYNQAYVAVHTGLEVQIDDMARGDSSREFQGTPYDVPAGDRIWHQHAPPLSPGVWFHYEIDVQDRLIVVRLAGMQTTRYENTDSFRGQSPGYIGLQAHRGHVRFTNVRIKEQ